MAKTGQVTQVSGIYRANCGHRPERAIPKGHIFPPCPVQLPTEMLSDLEKHHA